MKTISFIKKAAVALIVAAVVFAGCNSAPDGVITMTTAMEGEVEIRMAGTGSATIDWGNGSTPETVTLSTLDENWSYLRLTSPRREQRHGAGKIVLRK